MADEFIRQLPHDEQGLDKQWSEIFDKFRQLFDSNEGDDADVEIFKVKALDALVDYILAEPDPTVTQPYVKIALIENVMKHCAEDPMPSLPELVRLVQRILDREDVYNQWFLSSIEAFHFKFRLCENLITAQSFELVKSFLESLQRHTFLNDQVDKTTEANWQQYLSRRIFSPLTCDSNKLNDETAMVAIRPTFQQIFRHAARYSHRSRVWESIIFVFTRTLPTLFDCYMDPADALLDFALCIEEPICSDYIMFISTSANKNPNLIKKHFSQILTVIEHLLVKHHVREVRAFLDQTILSHFEAVVDVEALVQMLIHSCPLVPVDQRNENCKSVLSNVAYKLGRMKLPKKSAATVFEFGLVLLDLCVHEAPACALYLFEKNEFYPWKDLAPRFTELVRLCASYDTLPTKAASSDLSSLTTILRVGVDRGKAFPVIFRATHDEALRSISRWANLDTNSNENRKIWPVHVYQMGQTMLNLIDRRQVTVDLCIQFIEGLRTRIVDNESAEDDQTVNLTMNSFFLNITSHLADYIDQLKILSHDAHSRLADLILKALLRPLRYESGNSSFEHCLAEALWGRLCSHLTHEADIRLYEPCVRRMHSLACEEDEAQFFNSCLSFWTFVTQKAPDVAANYVEDFFADVLDRKQVMMTSLLPMLYFKRPEVYHARFDDIIDALHNNDNSYVCWLTQVFAIIAQERPQLIQSTHVDRLFSILQNRTGASIDIYFLFQGLGSVANAHPNLFDSHRPALERFVMDYQNVPAMKCLQQYFVASTIVRGKQMASQYLSDLIDLLKKNANIANEVQSTLFHTCQLIGVINKQALQEKRSEFVAFDSRSECRMLLDLIDGNKLTEEYQTAVNRTQDELTQMEKRVIKTEQTVQNVTEVVKQQELQFNNLDARVNDVDHRLTDVSEQVVAQGRDIERIDAKTLSHVPAEWGRGVSKLLNRRANNDWRLLGKRFGYSVSELRHWSLQADPSMALLNEWYMTHKADEATYGLVKMLDEIDRHDVSKIIREAVAAAGELIPDDMPMEIKRLPPVFLSYQWGTQPAVLILKNHLEQAGYACWMDTGQMGGGDKLFSKIDGGIRGAKVVVCCMNPAYAQSDNCSREVHLTVSTGKPLIPLQMEKQKWPPEGALGPIMSEYLFIRFFDRKGNDPSFWPTDKFAELLGQIRYYVAPDPAMITDRYRNWFVPRVNDLIFLQQSTSTENTSKKEQISDGTPLVVTHPQVMISYQWDRQTEIVALYHRLTQLGYRCWLDIFQMGGGDSLFEKIDSGIRHAKCVLACVTPKYIVSINCRREMSLTDALKKTIVPVYLEETTTWPPPGPMSMVFTDKPYLDFRRPDGAAKDHDVWTSKEFETLLARLREAVPEVQTEKPRRHLLEMKRPTTASKNGIHDERRSARVKSAPSIPQSRACSMM